VKAFNTWAFKREKPSDLDHLHRVVERAVVNDAPISFAFYWGKGPRCRLGSPDLECLSFLSAMAERIQGVYGRGAAYHLVFTDTHARLNGHSESSMTRYFEDVAGAASSKLFYFHRLSELVAKIDGAVVGGRMPDQDTLERLEKCAAKWFGGEGSVRDAATRYYSMNMIEKRAMESAFPDSVFITFNGSEFRSLFPDGMPIFYMYSLKKGVAVKPWFLPDNSNSERTIADSAAA